MNWSSKRESIKLFLVILWLIFTVVFALWWFKFSLDNVGLLSRLEPEQMAHWQKQERMIIWEGGSWLVLLILGGAALIALVFRERRRVRQIKEFFASFSHEIKTSLSSLRLQAEALKTEPSHAESPILDRLIGDTVRLQLQLENSLFLASQENLQLYLQPLALEEMLERMREQWPGLEIKLNRDCVIRGDERALRTILSNLIQNAIVHGGATAVNLSAQNIGSGKLRISVADNGSGFEGSRVGLGQLFHRPRPSSGSGMGLYISAFLLTRMNGRLSLPTQTKGFPVELEMEGSLS